MKNEREKTKMELTSYDAIVINSSAGKDSLAMLHFVISQADTQGINRDRISVVHADLGRVEWKGTKDLAERQAKLFGLRFFAIKRPQGDLLQHIESRGKWPSSKARYCTSDHKRGQCAKIITQLSNEIREIKGKKCRVRILNCMGFRAQESSARAKRIPFEQDKRLTNGKRIVDQWLPIHTWTIENVWDCIKQNDLPYHEAYDLGMPRLSCIFCIFAPKSALLVAGKHNPELLDEYCDLEDRINHTFRKDFKISSIRDELRAGTTVEKIEDWNM